MLGNFVCGHRFPKSLLLKRSYQHFYEERKKILQIKFEVFGLFFNRSISCYEAVFFNFLVRKDSICEWDDILLKEVIM